MPRLHATNASMRAFGSIGLAAPVPQERFAREIRHAELIRRALPFLILVFFTSVCFGTYKLMQDGKGSAVEQAQIDLAQSAGIRAALMAGDPIAATPRDNGASAADNMLALDALGNVLDASGLSTGKHVDEVLRIEWVEGQADTAGIVNINGAPALLLHHQMPDGRSLMTWRPIDDVLAGWKQQAKALLIIVATALLALVTLGFAYYQLAAKAGDAELICASLSKRAELALSRGRCGLWDWDLSKGTVHWSSSMSEIAGYEPREQVLPMKDLLPMLHDDDRHAMETIIEDAKQNNSFVDLEFRFRAVDGRWLWLRNRAEVVRDKQTNALHLIGFAIDITEQKALTDERAAADQRLRQAIDSISESFVLWDKQSRLLICNRKFSDFHGLSPEQVKPGTPYAQIHVSSDDPDCTILAPLTLADAGITRRTYELHQPGKGWLQVSEQRTVDGGYVSIGADITALKHHEDRLIENERRLLALISDQARDRKTLEIQAQKLSEMARRYREQFQRAEEATVSKSQFLANMSHELRTPLNAIIGFSQVMEQGIYGPLGSPRYDEYMADIRKSGEYLLGVISDLLNMSKIEAGTLKLDLRVDEITAPIALAIDSVRPAAAGKQIRIETEFGDDVHACFDNKAATHIFSHLFQNSVKFTRGGGKIITRTRVKNGYMHVFIADNGVGMAPDVLAGVGKPFDQRAQSLNNGMKGSGLGLAIAHSLCELHGGALSIRSKIQRGTVVRVKLPLEPDMSWSQNETSEDDPSDSMSHFPFEQGMDKAA